MGCVPPNFYIISVMGMGELQAAVQSCKIDFGITVTHDREAGWEGCAVYPVERYPAQIAVSQKHSWFGKDSISVSDLEEATFVRMEPPLVRGGCLLGLRG